MNESIKLVNQSSFFLISIRFIFIFHEWVDGCFSFACIHSAESVLVTHGKAGIITLAHLQLCVDAARGAEQIYNNQCI